MSTKREFLEACNNGNCVVVQDFLKKKPELVNATDREGQSALHKAAYMGHLAVVNCLIQNNADVNGRNEGNSTPLHLASITGRTAIVNKLLQSDAEVDPTDEIDFTPLDAAIDNNHMEVIKLLLQYDAEVDQEGNSALSLAASRGRKPVVELLIDKGANVNAQDINGETALDHAIQGDHLEVVKVLVEKGAEINSESQEDMLFPPLHYAVHTGRTSIVRFLLENNANLHLENKDGQTPLDIEPEENAREIKRLLEAYDTEEESDTVPRQSP